MRLPGVLAVAIVLVAGCGGDDEETTASDAPEATVAPDADADGAPAAGGGCELLSTGEVSDLIGEEVAEATELPTGCQWAPEGGATTGASWEWQSIPPESFTSNRETAAGTSVMSVEPIDGLGDDAFLRSNVDPDGNPLTSETWVLAGTEAFFVRTTLPSSDEVLAAEQALAEAILDRLG